MKRQVITVEANPAVQLLVRSVVEAEGFELLPFPQVGLVSAEKVSVTFALLAWEAGKEKVMELATQLKREGRAQFVVLTVLRENLTLVSNAAQEAGVDEILTKPFTSAELKAVLVPRIRALPPPVPEHHNLVSVNGFPRLYESLLMRYVERRGDRVSKQVEKFTRLTIVGPLVAFESFSTVAETIVVASNNPDVDRFKERGATVLPVPLTTEALQKVIRPLLPPEKIPAPIETMSRRLLAEDQRLRLLSQLVSQLLEVFTTEAALTEGRWDELARRTSESTLSICQRFDDIVRLSDVEE